MSDEECSGIVRFFCFFRVWEASGELIKENILFGFASRMDRLFIKGIDIRRDSTKNLYFCQTKADYVVRNTLVVSKKVRKNIDSEHI